MQEATRHLGEQLATSVRVELGWRLHGHCQKIISVRDRRRGALESSGCVEREDAMDPLSIQQLRPGLRFGPLLADSQAIGDRNIVSKRTPRAKKTATNLAVHGCLRTLSSQRRLAPKTAATASAFAESSSARLNFRQMPQFDIKSREHTSWMPTAPETGSRI